MSDFKEVFYKPVSMREHYTSVEAELVRLYRAMEIVLKETVPIGYDSGNVTVARIATEVLSQCPIASELAKEPAHERQPTETT